MLMEALETLLLSCEYGAHKILLLSVFEGCLSK